MTSVFFVLDLRPTELQKRSNRCWLAVIIVIVRLILLLVLTMTMIAFSRLATVRISYYSKNYMLSVSGEMEQRTILLQVVLLLSSLSSGRGEVAIMI